MYLNIWSPTRGHSVKGMQPLGGGVPLEEVSPAFSACCRAFPTLMDSTAQTLYSKITLSFPSCQGVLAQQQKGTQTPWTMLLHYKGEAELKDKTHHVRGWREASVLRRLTAGGEGAWVCSSTSRAYPRSPREHVQMIPTLRYSHGHTNKNKIIFIF